jgi:phenylpropionate dioxygenase-like ring-hydroxylating dioxygenase large terminal subunit
VLSKVLETYYMKSSAPGEQLIQAHCPTAIAKLIGRDHEKADHYKELFAADLQEKGKTKRSSNDHPAVVRAGPRPAQPPNDDKDDKKNPDNKFYSKLLDTWHDHKDLQTRKFFAALSTRPDRWRAEPRRPC